MRDTRTVPSPSNFLFRWLAAGPHGALSFSNQARRSVDCGARSQFRAAPQCGIAEFGIKLFERQAADYLVAQQAAVDCERVFLGLHHKLVESGSPIEENFAVPGEFSGGVGGLRQVLFS